MAALAVAYAVTQRASLDYLVRDPRFVVAPSSLRLASVPPWIPPEYPVAPDLPPEYSQGLSIFDPKLVEIVAAAYARSPWIERVERVEKRYPNSVRVAVALRRPVAAVAWKSRFTLVDAQAIVLPGRYDAVPHVGLPLPVIEGALSSPPPAGQAWRDLGVADGARLAYLWGARGMLDAVDVRRIDVHNVGGRVNRTESEVVVYLAASDTPLNWGRVSRSGRDDAIAVDDRQKLAILRSELVNSGMLRRDPTLAYVSYLDIQHGVLRIGRR